MNLSGIETSRRAGEAAASASAAAWARGTVRPRRAARKGQRAGTGFSQKRGFEGGQMPLHRRLPKRGFTNIFQEAVRDRQPRTGWRSWKAIRSTSDRLLAARRDPKGRTTASRSWAPGSLTRKITVEAHHFSKSALEKIQQAGGTAQVIGAQPSE